MLRFAAAAIAAGLALGACTHSEYVVRPVPVIAAAAVGKPVSRLREAFGVPRKVDSTPFQLIYVWFLPDTPAGAPVGLHGCELEVTVDVRSDHVLGYSSTNIGWGRCVEIERKMRDAED